MTLESILTVVSGHTGKSYKELTAKNRRTDLFFSRMLFTYIAVKSGFSFVQIGRFMGGRDHSTIIHQFNKAGKVPQIVEIYKKLNLKEPKLSIPDYTFSQHKKFRNIYERFGGKCLVCGFNSVIEICHIRPRYMGGKDTPDNLIILCPNHHAMFDRGLLFLKDIHIPLSYPQD